MPAILAPDRSCQSVRTYSTTLVRSVVRHCCSQLFPALRLLLLVRKKHGYHCSNQRHVHRHCSSVASDSTSDMQRFQNLSTVLCPAASAQFLWRQQRLSRLPKKGKCHLRRLQSAGEGKHLQPLPVKTHFDSGHNCNLRASSLQHGRWNPPARRPS